MVHILERFFDRDDVCRAAIVDRVEHRRQGRRLSGSRGARDEHEALGKVHEAVDDGRQSELLERRISWGITRNESADVPRWMKALARIRATPPHSKLKSTCLSWANRVRPSG